MVRSWEDVPFVSFGFQGPGRSRNVEDVEYFVYGDAIEWIHVAGPGCILELLLTEILR